MLTSIRQFLLLVPLILILAAAIVRPAGAGSMEARPGDMPGDVMADREALELLRSYYAIPEQQRRRLFDLARVLSDAA